MSSEIHLTQLILDIQKSIRVINALNQQLKRFIKLMEETK